jgi:hypothetical protein
MPKQDFYREGGHSKPKRLVLIADDSHTFIQCCFWADKATLLNDVEKYINNGGTVRQFCNPVILLKGVKVIDYMGVK